VGDIEVITRRSARFGRATNPVFLVWWKESERRAVRPRVCSTHEAGGLVVTTFGILRDVQRIGHREPLHEQAFGVAVLLTIFRLVPELPINQPKNSVAVSNSSMGQLPLAASAKRSTAVCQTIAGGKLNAIRVSSSSMDDGIAYTVGSNCSM
jgi:hypothetical protein